MDEDELEERQKKGLGLKVGAMVFIAAACFCPLLVGVSDTYYDAFLSHQHPVGSRTTVACACWLVCMRTYAPARIKTITVLPCHLRLFWLYTGLL